MCLQPTPVFGQAFATGTGGGFAGFTGVSTAGPSDAAPASAADGEDEDGAAAEEECQAEYKPVVQLEEVETSTGEEDEEPLTEL
jgi:Ran-binding protein 1